MKQYQKDFMPQGVAYGFCSLTVLLGILNYFFYTYFGAKDNWDLFGLAVYARRGQTQLLDTETIALFVERLFLDVTIYTYMTKEEYETTLYSDDMDAVGAIYKKYIKPQYAERIKGNKFYFEDGKFMTLADPVIRKRIGKSSIKLEYDGTREKIIEAVRQHQNLEEGGVLFVLGLNYHILYGTKPRSEADSGGHVVVSTGIDENNNFIIYEPINPRPNPHRIPVDTVLDAIYDDFGYDLVVIKDNPDHQ